MCICLYFLDTKQPEQQLSNAKNISSLISPTKKKALSRSLPIIIKRSSNVSYLIMYIKFLIAEKEQKLC